MLKVTICIGSSCHLKGSRLVVEQLQYLIDKNNLKSSIDLGAEFCMGQCSKEGVNVKVNGEHFSVDPNKVEEFFNEEILAKVQ